MRRFFQSKPRRYRKGIIIAFIEAPLITKSVFCFGNFIITRHYFIYNTTARWAALVPPCSADCSPRARLFVSRALALWPWRVALHTADSRERGQCRVVAPPLFPSAAARFASVGDCTLPRRAKPPEREPAPSRYALIVVSVTWMVC